MLMRHLVYVLIVLFFVGSNVQTNGTKLRIMETQLVPKLYQCDGSTCGNFTDFNQLPFDELRRLTLYYETTSSNDIQFCFFYGNKTFPRSYAPDCGVPSSVLNTTYEIAFGRDVLSYRYLFHYKDRTKDEGTYDFANIFPTSMITHFGFVGKNVVVKKITAQGWIYNGQSIYPFTKLLAGSDESCEFYISFDQAEVKPFTIYLISEKVVHHFKVVQNPTKVDLICDPGTRIDENEQDPKLDNLQDLRIHIVKNNVTFFIRKLEQRKCTLQSEGPYYIVVPRNLPIKVVKIAQNFLARNILQ
uniref:Uncharacterized protein n=1 Tax=Panagrolaimus sp. JU765 TaxID=591449 RepID=A0AC34RPS2_9BILA